jgi:hypothetical protein
MNFELDQNGDMVGPRTEEIHQIAYNTLSPQFTEDLVRIIAGYEGRYDVWLLHEGGCDEGGDLALYRASCWVCQRYIWVGPSCSFEDVEPDNRDCDDKHYVGDPQGFVRDPSFPVRGQHRWDVQDLFFCDRLCHEEQLQLQNSQFELDCAESVQAKHEH